MNPGPDIEDTVTRLKREGDAFAVATVVRTLSVTAAKPGAKAIINQQGDIIEGWIGGGCARHAVIKAAVQSINDGEPRLVSLHPDEVLKEQGLETGEDKAGRVVATNMCPSKGSMDIFVEAYLANPELIIVGASPVAVSLCQLAPLFNFSTVALSDSSAQGQTPVRHCSDWDQISVDHDHRYIVVATQGSGDLKALTAALDVQSRVIGFVGSRKKTAHLKGKLEAASHDKKTLDRIKGPSGLDIGAVTPNEIALSILAELVQVRRRGVQPVTSSISTD